MNPEALKAVYFAFYDQHPLAEKLKSYYTAQLRNPPTSLKEAIGRGFLWTDTSEGYHFWAKIHSAL